MSGDSPCIHCGFCLPACPTYDVLGTEMDNPRGRLMLMDGLASGRLEATPRVIEHLDLCLGCRACEAACPSGVPYGARLEQTRARLRADPARPLARRRVERFVLDVVALPPRLLRLGARLAAPIVASGLPRLVAGVLPRRASSVLRMLAAVTPRPDGPPARTPPAAPRRDGRAPRVALLTGCVASALFGDVAKAAARLLSLAGCEVVVPAGQGCCGALHLHAGDRERARELVRRNVAACEALGDVDYVVTDAAGCGSALKECGHLLADDVAWAPRAERFAGRVRDALQLLDELGLPPVRREVSARVACHDACHLAHAQGLPGLSTRLLAAVPGLELVPLADADRCCGSAGLYHLLQPELADALGAARLRQLRRSGADVVTASNPGCLMHLARLAAEPGVGDAATPLSARHPLLLLDEACRPDAGAR